MRPPAKADSHIVVSELAILVAEHRNMEVVVLGYARLCEVMKGLDGGI